MNGAPFVEWQPPAAMNKIKARYMDTKGEDRDFVELLMLVQEHGMEVVEIVCDLAVDQNMLHLPAIINLPLSECCAFICRPMGQPAVEPVIKPLPQTHTYPQLQEAPQADCKCYEQLVLAQMRCWQRAPRPIW